MIPTNLEELRYPRLDSLVQLFYVHAVVIGITLNLFPPLTRKLFTYGKNSLPLADARKEKYDKYKVSNVDKDATRAKKSGTDADGLLGPPLNLLGKLQVPHAWFIHFYAFSFMVQLFWLYQIFTHGSILRLVLDNVRQTYKGKIPDGKLSIPRVVLGPSDNQSFESILLCIICMGTQSSRRLYESIYIQKHGGSKMGIAIYIAGMLHYTVMGLATWSEGVDTIRLNANLPLSHPSIYLRPPRLNTLIGLPMFLIASGVQSDAHAHLASLVKYSLPTHPLFTYTFSPHYLAECVIYFSFVIIGAPRDSWVNITMTYVWVFVCVSLGFSARITRAWYEDKFGKEKVGNMWTLVPFVW